MEGLEEGKEFRKSKQNGELEQISVYMVSVNITCFRLHQSLLCPLPFIWYWSSPDGLLNIIYFYLQLLLMRMPISGVYPVSIHLPFYHLTLLFLAPQS